MGDLVGSSVLQWIYVLDPLRGLGTYIQREQPLFSTAGGCKDDGMAAAVSCGVTAEWRAT